MEISFIIFGSTGDLARRKLLPAINSLAKNKEYKINLLAIGRRDFSVLDFKNFVNLKFENNIHLGYFKINFDTENFSDGLEKYLNDFDPGTNLRIFYLATIPQFFEKVAENISKINRNIPLRIMIEKPFGFNFNSFNKLNTTLLNYFNEEQIYRVDHYLAKETIQNILILRTSNPFFERNWNSSSISKISIVVKEYFGVKDRIMYYDSVGAIKDMVQNHMLQVASLLLMDIPSSMDVIQIQEAKAKAVKQLRIKDISVGQYSDYIKELGSNSDTETYVKLTLNSVSKRWKNMDIVLETGKKMDKQAAWIEMDYQKDPCYLYCNTSTAANKLIINVQPQQDIQFIFNTKIPGKMELKPVQLNFFSAQEFSANTIESYEVIIEECINQNKNMFISTKELTQSWKLTDKIIEKTKKLKLNKY